MAITAVAAIAIAVGSGSFLQVLLEGSGGQGWSWFLTAPAFAFVGGIAGGRIARTSVDTAAGLVALAVGFVIGAGLAAASFGSLDTALLLFTVLLAGGPLACGYTSGRSIRRG